LIEGGFCPYACHCLTHEKIVVSLENLCKAPSFIYNFIHFADTGNRPVEIAAGESAAVTYPGFLEWLGATEAI
jgi:hypothetical protein